MTEPSPTPERQPQSAKPLAAALLALDGAPTAAMTDPQFASILSSDQRRIRWLTRATIALWILATLGVLAIYVFTGLAIPAISHLLEEAGEWNLDRANAPIVILARLVTFNTLLNCLSIGALVGAGLTTVLLVFRSRRATLRQINANLLEISEQLKHLTHAAK